MPRRKQSRGKCTYCGEEVTKSGMAKHLPVCPKRQAVIAEADAQPGDVQKLYHLRVQDVPSGVFWLDLEMNGEATLRELDSYLRAIWLECCDHLSEFSPGRGWGGREIPMGRRAEQVFAPGVELTHIYDFGTTSETLITCVAVREGKPTTPHPIALMARNLPPEAPCMECGQSASWLCIECMYEYEKTGLLCDVHAQDHPHDEYGGLVPLVNSPRVGMCGYEGPAEPPY
ncbi:MAG: hypothetical protein N2508_03790 [Anaerolineae bacterium]|nr:hypothetical protein [Anaerolineae bacterium]